MIWRIWLRDSVRAKWRLINTRDFSEYWEANLFIDKNLDISKDGEAVPLLEGETPYLREGSSKYA